MTKHYVLREDLVIPAGTVFHGAPVRTSYGVNAYQADIGLTKDNTATFTIWIEEDILDLVEEVSR